jgi:hypothetical protein
MLESAMANRKKRRCCDPNKFSILLAVSALLCHSPQYLGATSMVQIVTPKAIILASDSKMVDNSYNDLGNVEKIVRVSKTIAVASCDMAKIDDSVNQTKVPLLPRVYNFKYDFTIWIREIQPAGDVLVFTNQVAEAAKTNFADYGVLVRANAFSRRPLLVEYYVAGYSSDGTAQIRKITLPVDWDNAVILDPVVEIRHPLGRDPTFGFNAGCVHQAIDQVISKSGEPYKRAQELAKEPLDKLLGALDLTIGEAETLANALITVESEFSPLFVGLPVQTIVIEKPSVTPK